MSCWNGVFIITIHFLKEVKTLRHSQVTPHDLQAEGPTSASHRTQWIPMLPASPGSSITNLHLTPENQQSPPFHLACFPSMPYGWVYPLLSTWQHKSLCCLTIITVPISVPSTVVPAVFRSFSPEVTDEIVITPTFILWIRKLRHNKVIDGGRPLVSGCVSLLCCCNKSTTDWCGWNSTSSLTSGGCQLQVQGASSFGVCWAQFPLHRWPSPGCPYRAEGARESFMGSFMSTLIRSSGPHPHHLTSSRRRRLLVPLPWRLGSQRRDAHTFGASQGQTCTHTISVRNLYS